MAFLFTIHTIMGTDHLRGKIKRSLEEYTEAVVTNTVKRSLGTSRTVDSRFDALMSAVEEYLETALEYAVHRHERERHA